MGRTGDGEPKSKNTLHIKLSESIEIRAKEIWQNSYLRDIAFKDFCAAMIRLGLDQFQSEEVVAGAKMSRPTTLSEAQLGFDVEMGDQSTGEITGK